MRRFLSLLLALLMLPACAGASPAMQPFGVMNDVYRSDYQQIPGVTAEDIAAIEAMKAEGVRFTLGTMYSSEAFLHEDGTRGGFAVLLCAMLSDMIGIPFDHAFYEWEGLIEALDSQTLDFAGELSPTPERRAQYLMTDSAYERTVKVFTNRNAADLRTVSQTRTLRFGALEGTVTGEQVQAVTDMPNEIVYVRDYQEAANQLFKGALDAFFEESPATYYFRHLSYVAYDDYFPLIYSPVSLSTANPALAPVIRIIQAYLDSGGRAYLAQLYSQGNQDYLKSQLAESLTGPENAYLQALREEGRTVSVAFDSDNYPISFYNEQEGQFQGIAVDVLEQVATLTGIVFVRANAPNTPLAALLAMVDAGEAEMIAGMTYGDDMPGAVQLAEAPFTSDRCALLSAADHEDVEINHILFSTVGLVADSAAAATYRTWFPDSTNTVTFATADEAFQALALGDIDLLMGSENLLLSRTNYDEDPVFKANLVFDYPMTTSFGFAPSETALRTVVSKAQRVVDTAQITGRWQRKVFDYSSKVLRDTIPYLIGFVILLSATVVALIVFFQKNRRLGRNLEVLVQERTRALEAQTTTLETVFLSIPDLIFVKDLEGRFTQCNRAFERNMGRTAEEIIGQTDQTLLDLPADIIDGYTREDRKAIESRQIRVTEEQISSAVHGGMRLFETIKTPLIQGGRVTGVMGIARDITDRKAIEAAAQSASQAKSEFLSRVSHEIRTPLNAIIGMTHIARGALGQNTDKARRSLDEITTASGHLLGILNDVLDMSKIESGKFEIARAPFALRAALDEVASIIRQRCKEKYVRFESNIDALPDAYLLGDKLRLNQVLINLLGNAVKFTPTDGRIDFLVAVLAQTDEAVRLGFTVTDNGIGMTQAQLDKLFTAFEQTDSGVSARYGGTGLGLAISQNLVGLMGGVITVESERGQGSTFRFELPFPVSDGVPEAPEATARQAVDLSGKRLLLVEDVEINRLIVQELLRDTGIVIDEAEDGEQAVAMFAASPVGTYDLILMDIQMPVMDGYAATKRIRGLDRGDARTVPILAMTANAYQEDINRSLAVGMNGHLSKPIDLDVVMRTLEEVLAGK